jgi:hypothetical protein
MSYGNFVNMEFLGTFCGQSGIFIFWGLFHEGANCCKLRESQGRVLENFGVPLWLFAPFLSRLL